MGASYRSAIKWVAENDEPTITDLEEIEGFTTVQFCADLFDTSAKEVAQDILKARHGKREKCDAQKGCTLRKDHRGECVNEWGDTIKPPPVEVAP